jgi:hypothetical protein
MRTYSKELDETMLTTDSIVGCSWRDERSFGQRLECVIALHRIGLSGATAALRAENSALFDACRRVADKHLEETGSHAVELILGRYERRIFDMPGLSRITVGAGGVDCVRKSYFNGIPIHWGPFETAMATR